MSKKFFAVLVAIIVGLGVIVWLTSGKNQSGTSNSSSQPTDHVMGQGKKGVTVLEYGDYQCPICEAYYAVVRPVVTKFSQDIYFQFRNLPLSSIHQNAFAAARAAEAAGKQNKFWEMHDMLYDSTNWQTWTNASDAVTYFDSYAQQLGLNVDQFKQDYSSSEVNSLINADVSEFKKTGQQEATPTFFINGTYVPNESLADSSGPSAAKFTEVINAAIKAKNQ